MTPSKYILTPPDELHAYVASSESHRKAVYPDFEPWSHKKEEDQILLNYVAKGYYATSKVNFESISARSSLQESLPKLSDQLADQFSRVLHIREQEINRISAKEGLSRIPLFSELSGPGFLLPSRVTLTEHRRELWLQELSSPYASLPKLSKHIPHGLKRKQVLEQCYTKQIPWKRALWLIKCCYSMEWKSRKSKKGQKSEEIVDVNPLLMKEWTENFVYILEKLIFEMTQYYNDADQLKRWRTEVAYFLKLLGNCYTLGLIDKELFHHWLIEFAAKIENFEFLPLTLHIIMVFWAGIVEPLKEGRMASQPLFLISKTAEMLLSKYYTISHSKSMINDEKYIINDIKKNNKIKDSILSILQTLICRLFESESLEAFIFPNSTWDLYKPILYDITGKLGSNFQGVNDACKKLELISYRNELLKFNSSREDEALDCDSYMQAGSNKGDMDILHLRFVDIDFTKRLDDNPIDFDWASYVDRSILHVSQIRQMILWAVHPSRKAHYEANQLVAKILLIRINSVEGFQEYVVEDVIWSLVFQFAKLTEFSRALIVVLPSFYRLLNILITYGILKVPTYIRKLISSGILYLPESNDKFVHCDVLINLKISPLMKSQYNMVLRNVMEYDTSYYEKYNFDELTRQAEELKQMVLIQQDLTEPLYPLSIKIMVAEWYLTRICSGKLLSLDKAAIIKNFQIFCINLDAFHYYYKWIEFIVYHQLLSDIEALETLMDILLCYGKLFSQFINDHILFTKTFIFIYTKELKEKDSNSYAVTSFMPFWRFFMKSFSFALNIDADLRLELSSVYEEEKAKVEKLSKNKQEMQVIYNSMNGQDSKNGAWNFPEVFQTSLRGFLSSRDIATAQKNCRNNLLLLMAANIRDYNKFMSIYLKRKDFKLDDLIRLISSKLLTFEQIRNILGINFVLTLLVVRNVEYGLFFEYHKDHYIKNNFKAILGASASNFTEYYGTFLAILVEYGTSSKLASTSTRMIINQLKDNPVNGNRFLDDMLHYGISRESDNDNGTIEGLKPSELYKMLNFTNLWVFQAFTSYRVEFLMADDVTGAALHDSLFEILEASNSNCLCAHIFDQIEDIAIIEKIVQIFELDFFNRCLLDQKNSTGYMILTVDILTSLSQKFHKDASSNLRMSDDCFQLMQNNLIRLSELDETSLKEVESQLDVFLRIFTIHQNFIFQFIVSSIQDRNSNGAKSLINEMYVLFDKISFDLRLKLMLYEVLSSLKSYCIYVSTTVSDDGNVKFEAPEKLLNLPPFQTSSFIKKSDDFGSSEVVHLGLSTIDPDVSDDSAKCFIFNKREGIYWCQLRTEPYHNINNFQSENTSCFNNSCLNLSLFNASFDKHNPK